MTKRHSELVDIREGAPTTPRVPSLAISRRLATLPDHAAPTIQRPRSRRHLGDYEVFRRRTMCCVIREPLVAATVCLPNPEEHNMTRSRPITFLASAAVIPLIALAVAACGGGGNATAAPAPGPASSTTRTGPTTTKTAAVRVAKSSLGSILVNSP